MVEKRRVIFAHLKRTAKTRSEVEASEVLMTKPSDHPSSFHAWLSRHKIIFETVAVSCITAAAVFVSYLQWKATTLQTDISIKQSQPNFVISSQQIWNEKEAAFTDDELQIQNFGGPPRGLGHEFATVLQLTTLTKGDSIPRKIDIPVRGYYTIAAITSDAVTGRLVKLKGFRNDRRMADIETELREVAGADGYICIAELKRYVKLKYRDLFDAEHIEYFFVAPIGGGSRIPTAQGTKVVDRFDQDFDSLDGVDITNTSAKEIWARAIARLRSK